ncbi:hypothetical protein A6A19_07785 [Actinobacillus delphinicola]|uniref:TIGR03745 family integrating conjugative element membrane protein n=1 Tax=Actinobacillus delphinicola TaxID=51161 RepID=UPI00244159B7|nr:TIGR03745 family integrating conjugative element membrane protein [Actinobacillus delphinicola]MDG6897874.1 hypothetical protein [Actinobacillus delphinicola]
MFKKISTVSTLFQRIFLAFTGLVLSTMPALAALPAIEAPENNRGKGLMGQIKGYAADGIIFGGLIIAAVAFLVIAMASLSTFKEVQTGKKQWGDFGILVAVGIILLVVIIWLATEAAKIL